MSHIRSIIYFSEWPSVNAKRIAGKTSSRQTEQETSVPEDEESLRKIVQVLFPTGEPRTSFPNQEHREAGEPFSLQELKAVASRLCPGKSPGLDGIPNEVVHLIAKKNPQMLTSVFNKCLEEGIFPAR